MAARSALVHDPPHPRCWRSRTRPGVAPRAGPGTPAASSARPATPACGTWRPLQPLAGRRSRRSGRPGQPLGADLTIVGPEVPLSRGVVDRFSSAGLPILGPTQAAAALETSKTFAKAFMARHGVPTAAYHVLRVGRRCRCVSHVRTIRVPRRAQSRRPCRRQGRCRCPRCRDGPRGRDRDDARAPLRGGGRPRGHRGMPRGSRAVVLRA